MTTLLQPASLTRGPDDLTAWSRALREEVRRDAAPYRERLVLVAESFRASEEEPERELRWARATAHVLETCPMRLREGERLAGWHPSSHPDEARRAGIDAAAAYLRTQDYWCSASEGHMALDYPSILAEGLDGVLGRIRAHRRAVACPAVADAASKAVFYEAAEISLTALQGFIERYATLAQAEAREVADPAWQAELERLAAMCAKLAHEPAGTFREALQLGWFCFLGVSLEAAESHHCFGMGRLDQYLLPYLEADRAAGRLDEAEVDDLLDQLLIKCNEFDARNMSAVILGVAGRRPDGSDGTNELSWRLLDSCDRVRMYFPGLDIFWHRDMPPEFMQRACRLLRNGNGQPSFFNDEVIVAGLQRYGVPFEEAVDHLPSTCTETSIMGRTNPWVAWPYVNLANALLGALCGGRRPDNSEPLGPPTPPPETFDELLATLDLHLAQAAEQAVARGVADQARAAQCRPFPLLSCFIRDCLDRGLNISHGGARYNFLQPEAVGVSNVVDSLAAIRTLVEDEARYTLDDFRAALAADWKGWDELHRAVRRECPKYGNDDAWVNELFTRVASRWCDGIEGHRNHFGGPVLPGFLGWTVWIQFGQQTAATPDGRRAGEPLANSLAPCSGVKLRGIPSTLLSASGLDHSRGLGGITFNLRFNHNSLMAPEGPERLAGLIEAGLGSLGLYMLQVDVTSSATMRAAQERPEAFQDLYVRIGGYLVPFTLLGAAAQREVIERAELDL